jgi:hypothetical protein
MINLNKLEIEELLVSAYKSGTILVLSSRDNLIQVIDYTDDGSQTRHDESATQEQKNSTPQGLAATWRRCCYYNQRPDLW